MRVFQELFLLLTFSWAFSVRACEEAMASKTSSEKELQALVQQSLQDRNVRPVLLSRLFEFRARLLQQDGFTDAEKQKLWKERVQNLVSGVALQKSQTSSETTANADLLAPWNLEEQVKQVLWNRNGQVLLILLADGSVLCAARQGSMEPLCPKESLTNVASLVSTMGGFAALKKDGKVQCWGNMMYRDECNSLYGVVELAAGQVELVARKSDGSLECFGGTSITRFCEKIQGAVAIAAASYTTQTNISTVNTTATFAALLPSGEIKTLEVRPSRTYQDSTGSDHFSKILGGVNLRAIRSDGSVKIWGDHDPHSNWTAMKDVLEWGDKVVALNSSGTMTIYPTHEEIRGVKSISASSKYLLVIKENGDVISRESGLPGWPSHPDTIRTGIAHDFGLILQEHDGQLGFWAVGDEFVEKTLGDALRARQNGPVIDFLRKK